MYQIFAVVTLGNLRIDYFLPFSNTDTLNYFDKYSIIVGK